MLRQLMGHGKVPEDIVGLVADELDEWDEYVWDGMEKVLSSNGNRRIYDEEKPVM